MSKFDTNGGYFAPKDYLKVNEGGSHEENPNGGVQIGVDPEGTPNLLEEGEPVYKDYVYSDNIEAEKEFLEQNHLPGKYAGKLYSKIADDLFSEAEERPLDPISRNGLEALLGRLADAQEGQKQAKEQRDLEDELANLSPEELDQLEAMLAQGEEQPIVGEDMYSDPGVNGSDGEQGPVEPTWQMPYATQPMMANGGFLRMFNGDGKTNRFDGVSNSTGQMSRTTSPTLQAFINNVVNKYLESRNPGGVRGTYAIDRNFNLGNYKTIDELEQSEAYDAFTKYVMRNSSDPTVRAYLQALDRGTNQKNGVPLLFDNDGNLVDNWKDLFYERRYDQTPGIYHLNPEEIYMMGPDEPRDFLKEDMGPYGSANPEDWYRSRVSGLLRSIGPSPALAAHAWKKPEESIIGPSFSDMVSANLSAGSSDNGLGSGNGPDPASRTPGNDRAMSSLPTWPRYAGAIGSGLLGLYNAFQSPDRYTATRINPQVPEGRINLQNQVYNPVDQNMIANSISAQGNATNRALRNSGLGPSSAAAILAADNNTTGNLGTGFLQTWDANNQRRNAVIAANNQAEAQRANFDYTVDAARKEAFNRFAPYNAQNDLMVQRLNNQAEADKYTAISNQISNGLQALSGIGQENFAMNQVNSNPAFIGYGTGPNGWMQYNPYYQFWLENKDKVKK